MVWGREKSSTFELISIFHRRSEQVRITADESRNGGKNRLFQV